MADARELMQGAVDTHVHSAPDLVERLLDDFELARQARERGMAALVLKNHFLSTALRAGLVEQQVPGIRVLGSVVLNQPMGGMNPWAVEAAARGGRRTTRWGNTMTDARERPARPSSGHPVYPGAESLSAERAEGLAADPERQRLIDQMLAATTEDEIAAARRAQAAWLSHNPDDFGVLEAGEALSYAEQTLFGDELPDRLGVAAVPLTDR